MLRSNRRSGRTLISIARAGQVAWLCGNLYEALVDVPGLQVNAPRPPGLLGRGSPVRYYLPVAPPALAATTGALVVSARRGGDRRAVATAAIGLTSAIAVTAHLVRTVNVPMLRDSAPSADADRQRLVATWHRWNLARLAILAATALAFRRACPLTPDQ